MEVELSTIHRREEPHTASTTPKPGSTRKILEHVETLGSVLGERGGSQNIVEPPPTAFPASTPALRQKARLQYLTLCWTLFLAGWNDGTTGPLLPRMQTVYHVRRVRLCIFSPPDSIPHQVNFALVSLIFVCNCIVRPPIDKSVSMSSIRC